MDDELKQHLDGKCDLGTRVVAEFQKWGGTEDVQAITYTGLPGERMLAVEDRVAALERERRG